MNSPCVRLLALLLPAMALAASARGDDQDPSRTVPIPQGLKATLRLPEVAIIGDHIRGEFIVQNTGSEPVKIRAGEGSAILRAREPGAGAAPNLGMGEASIDPWLQVHVWNERAKLLPDMVGGPMFVPAGTPATVTLAPGESKSIYCPLERYVAILARDIYTVSVWNDLGWEADRDHPPLMATAEIEFRLPSAQSIATRVRTLCARDTEENNWELMHLWSPLFLPALREEARAGHAQACLGMSGIISEEANRVLLDLAVSKDATVARAAVYALSLRLPAPADPEQPALRLWNGWSSREQILRTWQPRFDAPLMTAAVGLMQNPPRLMPSPRKGDAGSSGGLAQLMPNAVALGARSIEARGSIDQVPAVLDATERALRANVAPRKGAQAMFAPAPLDALIQAIDALRSRGWRTNGRGDTAAMLAWFRQLAEPKIPKPADTAWQEVVRAALGSKSPVLRENAVRAMPQPLTDDWEPPLRTALEDEDGGVLCAACAAAGDSHRKSLLGQLVNVVVNLHQPEAQSAAMDAAVRLGGGVELWTALCEVIPEPAMTAKALVELVRGTMEMPPGGIVADSNLTPEEAVAARDAWKTFIERNRELLDNGQRVGRGDPSITPAMMLAVRTVPSR